MRCRSDRISNAEAALSATRQMYDGAASFTASQNKALSSGSSSTCSTIMRCISRQSSLNVLYHPASFKRDLKIFRINGFCNDFSIGVCTRAFLPDPSERPAFSHPVEYLRGHQPNVQRLPSGIRLTLSCVK